LRRGASFKLADGTDGRDSTWDFGETSGGAVRLQVTKDRQQTTANTMAIS
jgi:hypothetical protein